MMTPPCFQFPTLVAAGAINASFALPMKFMRKWSWENVWLVWALFGLLIFPVTLGCAAIPGFLSLYATAAIPAIKIACFGALWGVGQVMFGFALELIGISRATAIMLGISTALGTLVPLLASFGAHLAATRTLALIAGVALAIAGVVLCSHAVQRASDKRDTRRGIAFAVAAGFGAGLFNFSMAFGGRLIESALKAGSPPSFAQLAAWTPFLLAGALANVGYCVFRLIRRKTYLSFANQGTNTYWIGGILMASLWLGSALLYGTAVGQMGSWGAVFAWPVYMSLIVIDTAVIGVIAGEWREASLRALLTMTSGLAILVVAVFVISSAQYHF